MLLSYVSRPFHFQNWEAKLTWSNLKMYLKSFFTERGRILGRIPVSRCLAEILIVPEEECLKLFGPFSTGLCLCFTISSPSQERGIQTSPKERAPEAALGTKHFVQWLKRDTCRHSLWYLKMQGGWLTVRGDWLGMVLFSPHVAVLVIPQR